MIKRFISADPLQKANEPSLSQKVINVGKKISTVQLPQSLNWIYGFGFKVGVFLTLKNFLIFRYGSGNLSVLGHLMVLSQLIMSIAMMICGVILQDSRLYDDQKKVRKVGRFYLYPALFCSIVIAVRELRNLEYFRNPESVNWFVDFFTGLSKNIGEISWSIVFLDSDLWTAFCVILFLVTWVYRIINFPTDQHDNVILSAIQRLNSHRTQVLEERGGGRHSGQSFLTGSAQALLCAMRLIHLLLFSRSGAAVMRRAFFDRLGEWLSEERH